MATVLATHKAAAPERLRGIRHSMAWDADPAAPGSLQGPRAGLPGETAGLAQVASAGLRYDEHLLAPQLPDLVAAAHAVRPYVETCIEAFGADRCMFESNFPVDRGTCDYATLWNGFKLLAAGAADAERTALFSGTAARVYRLAV